ncbi:MAG: right-handed parallel beta-helix repeat-containing protein [Candidatus Hodarchaeales archaeon]|jgi:parallel beta-helix repeat protein
MKTVKMMKIIVSATFLLLVLNGLTFESSALFAFDTNEPQSLDDIDFEEGYIGHSPIDIDGNTDFQAIAVTEGWSGNGSSVDPYIIEGLSITGRTDLIYITNTDVHFQIKNNLLNEGFNGVVFENVTNAEIFNNTMSNSIIYKQTECCKVMDYQGILLMKSHNIIISGNIIFNNSQGIQLMNSSYVNISYNTLSDNLCRGVTISEFSTHNLVRQNKFIDNRKGVFMGQPIPEGSQAHESFSSNNEYSLNYWSDWTGTDVDQNSIGDEPYNIAGRDENKDSLPVVSSNLTFSLQASDFVIQHLNDIDVEEEIIEDSPIEEISQDTEVEVTQDVETHEVDFVEDSPAEEIFHNEINFEEDLVEDSPVEEVSQDVDAQVKSPQTLSYGLMVSFVLFSFATIFAVRKLFQK